MVNALSPAAERFLLDLGQIGKRAERAQRQIGSGLRIQKASDDPGQVPELLRTRARLEEAVQVQANLNRLKTEVDAGETGLQSAVKLMDRALVIATEGSGTLATPERKQVLANEVAGLLERLHVIAGTTAGGRRVFADSAREATDPDGFRFAISRPAVEVFQSSVEVLNSLREALGGEGVELVLPALKAAQGELGEHLAFYGAVQNRIDEGLDTAAKRQVQGSATLAAIRETDVAAAAIELTEAETHQQIALSARGRLTRSTLFDYLG